MNPEVKAAWLAALRSGEYQQGQSQLRSGDSFCCLGVLCDLHAKATEEDNCWVDDSYLNETETLPRAVVEWAGLIYHDPKIGDDSYLSEYNDGCKICGIKPQTFNQIADLIEQHL